MILCCYPVSQLEGDDCVTDSSIDITFGVMVEGKVIWSVDIRAMNKVDDVLDVSSPSCTDA